ncbi:MAG: M1 family metallopeptidase, partial [Bacteroidota bacterium]|nr:M1 family metallopeptidase [Bacteroidota bacterium]
MKKKVFIQFKFAISLLVIFLVSLSFQSGAQPIRDIGDTIHAVHYEIHLREINTTAKTIAAKAEVNIKSKVDNLISIPLQLRGMTIDTVWIDQVETIYFVYDDEVIYINLPSALQTGDSILIGIAYNGEPYHESWGGYHFSGDYSFNLGVGISEIPHNLGKSWFPCIDDFTDRATYDVYATVDQELTAVGGGELMSITSHAAGTRTFHWKLHYPIPTYLISIATGDYVLIEDTYIGAERNIPITYYVRPVDSVKVYGNFANLKAIAEIYEDHFGDYAWERIGYVGTAIGAMEHATNIAYPNSTITGNNTYEWLYAHELFHMWFGDKITCCSAEEMWINEGWATFAQMFYTEILYNRETFINEMMSTHANVLQYQGANENGYFPLNEIPQEYTYGLSAYDKGSTVVQSLRTYLGDDIFFPAMTAFLDSLAFTSVSSYDMRDFLTEHTGIDMTGFFDLYVLNGGCPNYSIDSFAVNSIVDDFDVTVYVRQKRQGTDFIGAGNIIPITFMDEDWNTYDDTVHFSGVSGQSTRTVPFSPVAVFIDMEHNMYDATTDDYFSVNTIDDYDFDYTFFRLEVQEITDSAFVRVAHHWAPPDSLKTPVPDLRISDYRYWEVGGIFPDDFVSTGRFQYSRSGYLDNTLILSETDSAIILYRLNPAEDWQVINSTRLGPWSIGYLYVDSLKI